MNNDQQPTECVGSLLVHQSDMKELSAATNQDQIECVGSLLVSSSDVQHLSEQSSPSSLPAVHLKQRISVGTLLVTPEDVRSPDDDHGLRRH